MHRENNINNKIKMLMIIIIMIIIMKIREDIKVGVVVMMEDSNSNMISNMIIEEGVRIEETIIDRREEMIEDKINMAIGMLIMKNPN